LTLEPSDHGAQHNYPQEFPLLKAPAHPYMLHCNKSDVRWSW
jgi:hypothetical protein